MDNILNKIKLAQNFIDKKSNMPMLSCVKITDGKIYATDLESSYICNGLDTSMKLIAEPDKLLPFIKNNLDYKSSISLDEYPNIQEHIDDNTDLLFSTTKSYAKNLIDSLASHTSKDETRYNICGTNFKVENGQLVAYATDGHRLIRHVVDNNTSLAEANIIVPRIGLEKVKKSLKYLDKDSTITFSLYRPTAKNHYDTLVVILGDMGTAYLRLIDGQFPDVAMVMPSTHSASFDINTKDLKNTLKQFKPLFTDEFQMLTLASDRYELSITRKGLDATMTLKLPIQNAIKGKMLNNLCCKYLLDVINAAAKFGDSSTIKFETDEKMNPVKIIINDDVFCIVMPIKDN